MFKKPISLALTILGATATCWVAACGSSNKATTGGTSSNSTGSTTGHSTVTGNSTSTGTGTTGSSTSVASTGSSSSCAAILADGGSDALIDNMTGTSIAFVATCAEKGAWYTFADDGATVTPAQGSTFTYSALPSNYPGPGGGTSTASDGGDGGSGAFAACVSGTTAATQYAVAGLGVQLGSINPPTDGGASTPALIDGSAYTGVEFWLWASSTTAAAVSSSLIVQFGDVNEDPNYGICNADASGLPTSCGSAGAAVSGSAVASSNQAGALTVTDGGNATIAAGWQLIQVPWTNFLVNQYYGGAQETQLDPTALTKLQFQIQQVAADAGAGITFDFCVKDVQFYN